jgi:hypothetical protein
VYRNGGNGGNGNGGNGANGAARTVTKDAVRKITPKTEAIETQIVKILIGRLICALAGRSKVGISSSESLWALVSSGRSLLASKGVLSEMSAIF